MFKLLHVKLPKANQALHQTGIGVRGVNRGKPGDRLVNLKKISLRFRLSLPADMSDIVK